MTNEHRPPMREGVEHQTPAEPHTAPTSERIVLNNARAEEDPGFMQRMADTLLAVAGRSAGAGRAELLADLESSLAAAGLEPNPVVVDGFVDAILRATRSSLVVESDDGVVLGRFQGEEPGGNDRVHPDVSDPADPDRPFYS